MRRGDATDFPREPVPGLGRLIAVHKLRIVAVLLAGALLPAGCGGSTPPGDAARIDAKLVAGLSAEDARAAGQAVNAFGFDLLEQVSGRAPNTITAPLSMSVLLAMILAGADGTTATEIAEVLHLDDRRDVRVGALLGRLADTDDVTLSVADSLWADEGIPLEKDYLTYVRDTFGATAQERDLGSADTAQEIDDWAADNTNGLIDAIAQDLGLPNALTALVLLNAVYFLGKWTTPFEKDDTRPATFTTAAGEKAQVPTMHLRGQSFGYAQRDGFRMLRLPYGEDGRYGMEILLPDDGKDLAGLDAARWRAAVDSLAPQPIDEVALPAFELRWKGELTEPLRKLGMVDAFTAGRADFRSMSAAAPSLGRVVHKTYIKVDERGTEAAAVSGAEMPTSMRVDQTVFRVDRPFVFTISDRQTGTILFLGKVGDPRR